MVWDGGARTSVAERFFLRGGRSHDLERSLCCGECERDRSLFCGEFECIMLVSVRRVRKWRRLKVNRVQLNCEKN